MSEATPIRGGLRPSEDEPKPCSSLLEQAELLAAGRVSATGLTESTLTRARVFQPLLRPFRVLVDDEARASAEAADERRRAGERGPLLGVPIAIKDDVDLAGQTTPFGCGGEHPRATEDSELVRRLKEAGAVIVGKTMAPEVGQWHFSESETFGAARNPWDLSRTPGGSSGGAAAAVAAGIVAGAIGSDGAGSIRIPAAWCGLVGLKPQRGRISTWPEPDSFCGLTCFGPITRTVGDAALLLDTLAGSHDEDIHRPSPPVESFSEAATRDPGKLRIAISFATPPAAPSAVDPEIAAALDRLAGTLRDLGHRVIHADPSYGPIGVSMVPRGSAGVSRWCARVADRSALEPRTRMAIRFGSLMDGLPLRLARRLEPSLQRRVGRIFERVDVVVTPTTAQLPPPVEALKGRGWKATSDVASALCPFAWAWNVLGWPALSVPAGHSESGLPIGAQLLGRRCDETTLLSLGAQLERELEWPLRTPPLPRSFDEG